MTLNLFITYNSKNFLISFHTTILCLSIKSNEGALQYIHSAFSNKSSTSPTGLGARLLAGLLGEERPRDMLILLTILVLLLHAWLLTVLMRPEEKVTEAKPLVMEVSMIIVPAAKPTPAPAPAVKPVVEPPKPLPPPTPPPVKEKTKPKPKPKPVIKKAAPVVQETPDFAKFEPFEPFKPTPPTKQASTESGSNKSTPTTSSSAASSGNASAFTEANYKANYAHNPKPDYPAIAKSRGWQGKVLLRVKVSAQGLSETVTVEKSSGREILDESAIEAVKKWRFIPAKRGETPVASSVIVPIDFKLRN